MEKKRILVIDDEQALTRLLKLNLENTGRYAVHFENEGAKGVTAAAEFDPHVIVLDLVLQDMDGRQVASKLRQTGKLMNTPIIFLTGSLADGQEPPDEVSQAGVAWFSKPVSLVALMETIEHHATGI